MYIPAAAAIVFGFGRPGGFCAALGRRFSATPFFGGILTCQKNGAQLKNEGLIFIIKKGILWPWLFLQPWYFFFLEGLPI